MTDGDILLLHGRKIPREETERKFEKKFGKGTPKLEINPKNNIYLNFKRGYLVIYGSDEEFVDESARLYFSIKAGLVGGDLFYIPVNNLKKNCKF